VPTFERFCGPQFCSRAGLRTVENTGARSFLLFTKLFCPFDCGVVSAFFKVVASRLVASHASQQTTPMAWEQLPTPSSRLQRGAGHGDGFHLRGNGFPTNVDDAVEHHDADSQPDDNEYVVHGHDSNQYQLVPRYMQQPQGRGR
jgi:hypothetical protein